MKTYTRKQLESILVQADSNSYDKREFIMQLFSLLKWEVPFHLDTTPRCYMWAIPVLVVVNGKTMIIKDTSLSYRTW